jgi:hypothetical protein
MKTDEELRERLRRASGMIRPPEDPLEGLHRRRVAKRRHDRLAAGGVALVLFVAAVGGSLYALRGGSQGLRHAAGGGDPSLVLAPGQYFYGRMTIVLPTETDGENIMMQGGTVVIESWWAEDASGRLRGTNDGAGYGLPQEGTWEAGEFPIVDDISELSLDPATLYEQLRQRSAPDGASPQPLVTPTGNDQSSETGGLWRAVKYLLEWPNATPEFRAALLQAAELVPGVHRVEGVTDPVGRSAYGLTIDIENFSDRIDVDPTTLQPLALESTLDGQTSALYQIWEEGIVDSTEAPPSGGQWFTPEPTEPMPEPGTWHELPGTGGGGPSLIPPKSP